MARSQIILTIVTVFQFISMAFLIICCVTAPVFKQIGLSKYDQITYGVFGYCNTGDDSDGSCSKASASYDPYSLGNSDDSNWQLGDHARNDLGKILIITPVAAGLNFFSFLASFISVIILSLPNNSNNGTFSAVFFFLNLIFNVLGFLSAALMCIVVFLLFWPHMTWCSWLLIPAAVLPLINIPIIFLGYFNNNTADIDMDNLDYSEDGNHLLTNEFGSPSMKDLDDKHNNTTFAHTVLPDFQPQNNDLSYKPTMTTLSTTDVSSNPLLEKKEGFYTGTIEKESTPGLSNASTYNNQRSRLEGVTTTPQENEGEDDDIDNADAKRDSFMAFSAIDNDADVKKNNHAPSLSSSNFSTKNLNDVPQPSNKLLEDIYNGQNGSNNKPNPSSMSPLKNMRQNNGSVDERSDFTSISQRPINPNYYGNNNNNNNMTRSHRNIQNNMQNLPYQNSPSGTSSVYPSQPQQQYQNYQQNNQYLQPQQRYNHQPQQRYNYQPQTQHQQQYSMPSAGPDPSQMILQNNPDFIPQGRHVGAKKRFNNMNRAVNNLNMNNGPGHFQNAYKKKMADRNNIYNNLHSQQHNPYEFR